MVLGLRTWEGGEGVSMNIYIYMEGGNKGDRWMNGWVCVGVNEMRREYKINLKI